MERFSRVTHFLKDTFLGQNDLILTTDNADRKAEPEINALMESFNGDFRESNNDGFEVIYKVRKDPFVRCFQYRFYYVGGL